MLCILRFLIRYNDMYPQIQYHTEWLHCPEYPLCSINFCLPSNSGNHWSFYSLHGFAVSRMSCSWSHTVGSPFWLAYLRNMHLRFLHVFSWLASSFLWGLGLLLLLFSFSILTFAFIRCLRNIFFISKHFILVFIYEHFSYYLNALTCKEWFWPYKAITKRVSNRIIGSS